MPEIQVHIVDNISLILPPQYSYVINYIGEVLSGMGIAYVGLNRIYDNFDFQSLIGFCYVRSNEE